MNVSVIGRGRSLCCGCLFTRLVSIVHWVTSGACFCDLTCQVCRGQLHTKRAAFQAQSKAISVSEGPAANKQNGPSKRQETKKQFRVGKRGASRTPPSPACSMSLAGLNERRRKATYYKLSTPRHILYTLHVTGRPVQSHLQFYDAGCLLISTMNCLLVHKTNQLAKQTKKETRPDGCRAFISVYQREQLNYDEWGGETSNG